MNEEEYADIIRREMYMYEDRFAHTVEILYQNLQSESRVHFSESTLRRFLKTIGFSYRVIDKRVSIMESERISRWQYDYLEKIKKFREEGRCIYYLDETWYDTGKKAWTDSNE